MAGHHLRALGLDAQELTGTSTYIAVAGAVETIATDAVLLVQLIGDSIHKGLWRHGLMEGGVEYTHLRQTGHQLLHGVHTLQVSGVV